jgi:hypothetical protein
VAPPVRPQGKDDAKTAVYFYEKCLEIARITGDRPGEMFANGKLGAGELPRRPACTVTPTQ